MKKQERVSIDTKEKMAHLDGAAFGGIITMIVILLSSVFFLFGT